MEKGGGTAVCTAGNKKGCSTDGEGDGRGGGEEEEGGEDSGIDGVGDGSVSIGKMLCGTVEDLVFWG